MAKKAYIGVAGESALVDVQLETLGVEEMLNTYLEVACTYSDIGAEPIITDDGTYGWGSNAGTIEESHNLAYEIRTDQLSLTTSANYGFYAITSDGRYKARITFIDYSINATPDEIFVYEIGTKQGRPVETKKMYIGIDNVARKIKKAYVGVDNVARLCYTAGVEWRKYSCALNTSDGHYKQDSVPSGGASILARKTDSTYPMYTDYGFSSSTGFYATVNEGDWFGDALVGALYITDDIVQRYDSVYSTDSGDGYTRYNMVTLASATWVEGTTTFSKGDTDYGSVYVDEGVLPGEGILLKGSANDSYCILSVNATTNYYYEKV